MSVLRRTSYLLAATAMAVACGGSVRGSPDGSGGTGNTGGSGARDAGDASNGGGASGAGGSTGVGGAGGSGGTSSSGCDLSVIASGELPPLPGDAGSVQLSGPTVAASSAGFVIGYRSQIAGELSAHAALLSKSGTLNPPSTVMLVACPGKSPADGVGLAFSGANGLMALALPDCDGQGAGAFFMAVAANAQLSALKLARSPGQFQDLTLASTHSLSGTGAPNQYDFVYRATLPSGNPQMQLAPLAGNSFGGGVSSLFNGEATMFGMVASTAQIQALLGQVPNKAAVELDVAGPGAAAGNGEAGAPHAFLLPQSDWGAVTAWNDRAAAIAPGAGSGLTVQAVTSTGQNLGLVTLQGDQFSSGDIVALRDHLIVVGAEARQFTLFRVDGALGTPSTSEAGSTPSGALVVGPRHTLSVTQLSLPDGGGTFDGHQVSIAAAGDEVAVVWRSKLNPDPAAPGGWALLKCAQ